MDVGPGLAVKQRLTNVVSDWSAYNDLSVTGRAFLWQLVARGALRIVADGYAEDEQRLQLAESNLRALLDAADTGVGGVAVSATTSAGHLKEALRTFCPGFWPFC